jgi:hypothetical protein
LYFRSCEQTRRSAAYEWNEKKKGVSYILNLIFLHNAPS